MLRMKVLCFFVGDAFRGRGFLRAAALFVKFDFKKIKVLLF